jgi:hypothetical protein
MAVAVSNINIPVLSPRTRSYGGFEHLTNQIDRSKGSKKISTGSLITLWNRGVILKVKYRREPADELLA